MCDREMMQEIENLKNEIAELKSEKRGIRDYFKKAFARTNVFAGVFIALISTSVIVYAAQVLFSSGEIISSADVNSNFSELYSATAQNTTDLAGLDAAVTLQDGAIHTNATDIADLEALVTAQNATINTLVNLLDGVTRDGDDIIFSGVNVNIVNGTDTTDGIVNGLGNLIVGYNELRVSGNDRTGSHNIVVGRYHNYSSHGGLVVGQGNAIAGQFATVSGGSGNRAAGDYSSVSGGHVRHVTGSYDWAAGSLFQED